MASALHTKRSIFTLLGFLVGWTMLNGGRKEGEHPPFGGRMSTVQEKTRRRFPRLSSNAFEHPLDQVALEVVRKVPFIDKLFKKVIELGFERRLRVELLGQAVHVTPKQCPRIYKLLREACDILDMHEPDLFLINHFTVNAW